MTSNTYTRSLGIPFFPVTIQFLFAFTNYVELTYVVSQNSILILGKLLLTIISTKPNWPILTGNSVKNIFETIEG